MHFVFRTDASVQIGTGHVMRCLTLADALRDHGKQCSFICRPHEGHLFNLIAQRGHKAISLAPVESIWETTTNLTYASWLGTDLASDAAQTLQAMGQQKVDWLIVDHYALDRRWEEAMRPTCKRILVIDDLANRLHDCDFLLDQNLGRSAADYKALVSGKCKILVGTEYALLRPNFARLRNITPIRQELSRILVFFGGSDPTNETLKAVRGILMTNGPWKVDIVIGAQNPHRNVIEQIVSEHQETLELHIQTEHMAELMAAADLAIGACGTASWERCSLKLPSLICVLADNQAPIAEKLDNLGAVVSLGRSSRLESADYAIALTELSQAMLRQLSEKSGALVDGAGVNRVIKHISTNEREFSI